MTDFFECRRSRVEDETWVAYPCGAEIFNKQSYTTAELNTMHRAQHDAIARQSAAIPQEMTQSILNTEIARADDVIDYHALIDALTKLDDNKPGPITFAIDPAPSSDDTVVIAVDSGPPLSRSQHRDLPIYQAVYWDHFIRQDDPSLISGQHEPTRVPWYQRLRQMLRISA